MSRLPFARFEPARPRRAEPLPPGLVIRRARGADAEAIGALAPAREGGDAASHAEGVRQRITAPDFGDAAIVMVAEAEGRVVAYGSARRIAAASQPAADPAPPGWYLTGVVVELAWRRRGLAALLTAERLAWIAARADAAFYFANARNLASIALHERFGFAEIARGPAFGGVSFEGGEGVLFRASLAPRPAMPAPNVIDPDHFLDLARGEPFTREEGLAAWEKAYAALVARLAVTGATGTLYVVFGLQGGGKSTWIEEHRAELGERATFFTGPLPTRRLRSRAIGLACLSGARVVGVWIDVPFEIAAARNAERVGLARVPDHVLRHVHESLEPPTLDEGFDEIVRVTPAAAARAPPRSR